MEVNEKKAIPPYVAYKTLSNFVDRFKQGLPGRIDRGLMGSMSGAAQSQVTTALRYLGMISENSIPTEMMRLYATGQETERKESLKAMLTKAYPFVLDERVFSFSTATAQQLREAFETNTAATGETVGRCIAFLKDAAADAGIKVSPYITQKKARTNAVRKRVLNGRKEEGVVERPVGDALRPTHTRPGMPAHSSMLLTGLFQRLPEPGKAWPKSDREQWLQTLQNVLLLEYPEG